MTRDNESSKPGSDGGHVLVTHSDQCLLQAPIPSALIALGMLSWLVPGNAVAVDSVSAVAPLNGSNSAPQSSTVLATLTGPVTSGLNSGNFVVHSSQTARTGAATIAGLGTANISLDPFDDFHPGEEVQATVGKRIRTQNGKIIPRVWQFRTRVSVRTSGTFIDDEDARGGLGSYGVSLGDVDGDGDLDAFILSYGQPNRVWKNNGRGVFNQSSAAFGSAYSQAVELGDVDGDGDLDAFVANRGQANRVWRNNGNGGFSTAGSGLGDSNSLGLSLGDLDGDGDLDAYVANFNQPDRVWRNDGDGGFTQSNQALGGSLSTDVELGDLDEDGDLDAFVTNSGANSIWINDGNSKFSDSGATLGNALSYAVELADLDGDGDLDAFVANFLAPNRVWLNNGDGSFRPSGNSLGNARSFDVALGDVDGDGDLDAFVANGLDEPNRIWFNNGQGNFNRSSDGLGASASGGIRLGDVDADGDLDAFVTNRNAQRNLVWLNTSDSDSDGIQDADDNCPGIANPNQENLDGDAFGDLCDDDVDGDGRPNASDPDDDNDGARDTKETRLGTDPFDPDTDDDGIVDGLDRDPGSTANHLCAGHGEDALFQVTVNAQFTCAASHTVTVVLPGGVDTNGDLLLIAPKVYADQMTVKFGGTLQVMSKNPTAQTP